MSTAASKAFHTLTPPRLTGQNQVESDDTSTSADEVALFSGLSTDAPTGKVMVVIEALTYDCYVVFKTGSSSATVTTATGVVVQAGERVPFWLNPSVDTYMEHIAAGTGKIKWFVASPEYDGT